jgi:hypothetical protein
MEWTKWLTLLVGIMIAVGFCLAGVGSWRWDELSQKLHKRLGIANLADAQQPYSDPDLVGLPLPVKRYLRIVLKNGQPIIRGVKLTQTGTFNMNEQMPNWKPFSANQSFVTNRPGFIWDARVEMFPLIPAHIHDAFIAGEGTLHVAILGLFTVADESGGGELANGELLRFLAEAPWYPTAFLPRNGLKWEAVDDNRSRATLTDGKIQVAMTFTFNSEGLIESSRAEARGRSVGKTITTAPWEGHYWNYGQRGNLLVPLEAEVAWIMPDGPKPYFRCLVATITYEE